jgi:alpha/beta superfamily hydrolase
MAKAPDKELLTLRGPAGNIEALLEKPAACGDSRVAVICHPHPQYKGTMHNKVVHTLARAMNDLGMPALRFNFRGTGASEGSYGEGIGEVEDVEAVAAYVRSRWPGARLWFAGFSFGAVVSARAAALLGPERLVSIAPAVTMLGKELPARLTMPWLIVQGGADEVVDPEAVAEWVATLEPRPQLVNMPGVGHFFHGQLTTLRTLLVERLADPPPARKDTNRTGA